MANLEKKFRAYTSNQRMGEREVSTRGGSSHGVHRSQVHLRHPRLCRGQARPGHAQPLQNSLPTYRRGTTGCGTIPDGGQDGWGTNRSLACAFENNIRTRFSRREYPKFETTHQQIRPETGQLQH
jgi:hypothetical protein